MVDRTVRHKPCQVPVLAIRVIQSKFHFFHFGGGAVFAIAGMPVETTMR